MMEFDPFQNRLCRNVRNDLSESLIKCIEAGDIGPAREAARKYLRDDPESLILPYINTRIDRYHKILDQILSAGISINDTYTIAALLWNQELFFEVHEWLEKKWHASDGPEKKVIQTLIRAAGTYVHLELRRTASARKIGAKALAGLMKHKASVPDIIDVDLLIEKIKTLDPAPPKFGAVV